jgi:hypothetical protein
VRVPLVLFVAMVAFIVVGLACAVVVGALAR